MNFNIEIDDRSVCLAVANELKESFTKYGSTLKKFISQETEKIIDNPDFQEKIRNKIREISENVSSEIIHSVVSEILKRKIKTIAKQQSEQGDLFYDKKDDTKGDTGRIFNDTTPTKGGASD